MEDQTIPNELDLSYPLLLDVAMYDGAGAFFPSAYCRLVTQVVEKHLENIRLDVPRLISRLGVSWVLLSLSLELRRPLHRDDRLTAKTWNVGRQGVAFRRDIAFYDPDGQTVAVGATFSTLFDLASRHVCTDRAIFESICLPQGRQLLTASSRFTGGQDFALVEQRLARPSWQDGIGHVNNGRYGEMVYDALSAQQRQALAGLKRLDVWFLSEMRPGDTCAVYKAEEGSRITVKGELLPEGRPSFAMQLTL